LIDSVLEKPESPSSGFWHQMRVIRLGLSMSSEQNPFSDLIEVLKHNGYSNAKLTDIPGPQFFNLLKKGGWDQAWSGQGQTHILMRLREPDRGPKCGINTLMDFARALETGSSRGQDEWISLKYNARFIVNWQHKGFVTFFPLT
jgi:hypothetical protein